MFYDKAVIKCYVAPSLRVPPHPLDTHKPHIHPHTDLLKGECIDRETITHAQVTLDDQSNTSQFNPHNISSLPPWPHIIPLSWNLAPKQPYWILFELQPYYGNRILTANWWDFPHRVPGWWSPSACTGRETGTFCTSFAVSWTRSGCK